MSHRLHRHTTKHGHHAHHHVDASPNKTAFQAMFCTAADASFRFPIWVKICHFSRPRQSPKCPSWL